MIRTITLAGGCFWGVQAYFDLQKEGIIKTTVGYANGTSNSTNYEKVCQGKENFVEACQITFDDEIITLDNILDKYWKIIDPHKLNQQGNDRGVQYRTGIYYNLEDEKDFLPVINTSKTYQATQRRKEIVTEVLPLTNYIIAEEYHQKYLEKNPHGYCHINLNIK